MAGINDCSNVMLGLVQKLVKNRVRPYYIYQCDLVHGAGHFRTPVAKGIEIMESLRGHTSGYAIPTFVIDAPEGGGKVPILPNYMLSMSDTRVVVRNYEGFITTYNQPTQYAPHNRSTCSYCQARRSESGQEGVAGLLAGHSRAIAPEGWRSMHQRNTVPELLAPELLLLPDGHIGGQGQLLTGAAMPEFAVEGTVPQNGRSQRAHRTRR
jgi:lysine 2,3-aminomutase